MNQWIESTSKSIVKWTFRVHKLHGDFYFGITSKETDLDTDFSTATCSNYCVGPLGDTYYRDNHSDTIESFDIEDGNLVTFTLNLISKKWFGTIHNGDEVDNELFDVEVADDIKYKFVLQLVCEGDSVTLNNFEIKY